MIPSGLKIYEPVKTDIEIAERYSVMGNEKLKRPTHKFISQICFPAVMKSPCSACQGEINLQLLSNTSHSDGPACYILREHLQAISYKAYRLCLQVLKKYSLTFRVIPCAYYSSCVVNPLADAVIPTP